MNLNRIAFREASFYSSSSLLRFLEETRGQDWMINSSSRLIHVNTSICCATTTATITVPTKSATKRNINSILTYSQSRWWPGNQQANCLRRAVEQWRLSSQRNARRKLRKHDYARWDRSALFTSWLVAAHFFRNHLFWRHQQFLLLEQVARSR